jgi:ABC-2 type transport system permease protein
MRTPTIDLSTRPAPVWGGLNPTIASIELRRVLRNRRTMIFTLIFPVVMFLLVSSSIPTDQQSMGAGVIADVNAYIAVSMALYGSAMAATSGGASVSVERASGWSRQLRLTPLNPLAYILLKVVTAFVLGAVALLATFVVAGVSGKAHMATQTWLESGAIIIVGSLVFAAFGLFMGYLIPSENVMQVLGPFMAVLGFLGGLFQGPVDTGSIMGRIQSLTPIYGLSQIAHWPLSRTTTGTLDAFSWWWVLNLAAWGAVFVAGAVWRFRKDTARV